MALRIRRGTAEDCAAIAGLARELNLHEGEPVAHFTVEAVRRDGYGSEPQFAVLLAELDGVVVGYALFHDSYDTGHAGRGVYLCDLHVTAAARRKGAGRALVAAVAREAQARGRSFVWWTAMPWNADAHAFYRSLGAKEEAMLAYALTVEALDKLSAEATDLLSSGD